MMKPILKRNSIFQIVFSFQSQNYVVFKPGFEQTFHNFVGQLKITTKFKNILCCMMEQGENNIRFYRSAVMKIMQFAFAGKMQVGM